MSSIKVEDLNNKSYYSQRTLFVASKINNSKSTDLNLINEVDTLFEDSDNYLRTDTNVIIGR